MIGPLEPAGPKLCVPSPLVVVAVIVKSSSPGFVLDSNAMDAHRHEQFEGLLLLRQRHAGHTRVDVGGIVRLRGGSSRRAANPRVSHRVVHAELRTGALVSEKRPCKKSGVTLQPSCG